MMERLLPRWLTLAVLFIFVVGETINPADFTKDSPKPDGDDPIKLSLSEGDSMVPLSDVMGLTDDAKSDILVSEITNVRRLPQC